ncbi:MAG TPA: glycosyltransferase family 2 protein [Actinomycetes bacterium]|nr:glycosyltransferase family 2 protein [Actinomycetes bacterium]
MPEVLVISVVVPVYNEQEVLPAFFDRLRPVLGALNEEYEVVVVDDGSTDDTHAIADDRARGWPQLRCLRLRRNMGHQAALTAGLDAAVGDWVLTIDADLQDPPELIPELLGAALRGQADVVYATRSDRKTDSRFKRWSAHVYYRLMAGMTETELTRHAGDFRLMSRRVVDDLNGLPERHRVYRLLVPYLGYESTTVSYERNRRAAGESKYPLGKMIRLALDSATSFSASPLRLATWLGMLGSLVSVLLGAVAVIAWASGATVPGWTSVMVSVFFVGAIQLLSLGLLGEYVGRIYSELQRRPRYFLTEDPSEHDD